jgi:hypothetical protein
LSDFTERDGLALGNREQGPIVGLGKAALVDIGGQHIDDVCAGVIALVRVHVPAHLVGVVDPEQVIQAVKVHEAVEQHAVELPITVRARLLAPPEPRPVHLVIRPPEYRHMRRAQLLQEPGDDVDL